MSPDHPVLRGTAQNPDAFFQAREACNPFYAACPDIVQQAMDDFAKQVGRAYKLFEYVGAPDAEHVIVLMGSGCEAAHETVEHLNQRGAKLGLVKVRLYRPFDGKRFVEALPRRSRPSRFWIAPRNRARRASRCIRIAWRPFSKAWPTAGAI